VIVKLLYKLAQLFGASATFLIGFGLSVGWFYEPRLWLKLFEIIGSFVAFIFLCLDILDIHPKLD